MPTLGGLSGIHTLTGNLRDFGNDSIWIAHDELVCEPNDPRSSPLQNVMPNAIGIRAL